MAGISPVTASEEQKAALRVLARGPDRAEADPACALPLTLRVWTGARIAQGLRLRQATSETCGIELRRKWKRVRLRMS